MNNKNKLILGGALLASATLLVGCDQLFPSSDTQFPSSIIISSSQNSSSINEKIPLELTMSDLTVTYDGQLHSISINETLPEGVNITYRENGKTNVGEYDVTATIKDTTGKYLVPSELKAKLCIVKADNTFELKDVTAQYQQDWEIEYDSKVDGQLSVKYLDEDSKTIEKPTEIGTYTIIGVLDAGDNYNIATDTATLTITKADVNDIKFESKTVSYNGSVQDLFIEGDLPEGVTVSYSGNGNINVGSYEVIATFTDTTGKYVVPQPMKATLTIEKAELTGITFVDAGFEYDENEHSIYIGGNLPEGVTVEYSGNGKSEIGDHEVIATFTDTTGNYVVPQPMKATMSIYNDGDYAVVKFNFGDRTESLLVLKDTYLSDIPSISEVELGYSASWDYDFTLNKVYRDLEVNIQYVKNTYNIVYVFPHEYELPAGNLETYDVDSEFDLEDLVVPDNYCFDGWYLENTMENQITKINKGTTGTITLYAKVLKMEIESHEGLFLDESGDIPLLHVDVEEHRQYFMFENSIQVSAGCTYEVYSDEALTNNVTKSPELKMGLNTFYIAVYGNEDKYVVYKVEITKVDLSNIVFMNFDGTVYLSSWVEKGSKLGSEVSVPSTKEGYSFGGWTTEIDGTVALPSSYIIADDLVYFYPVFEPNEYTITYVIGEDQDDVTRTVVYNTSDYLYVPNELDGYDFIGWDYEGTTIYVSEEYKYEFTHDITLTAIWESKVKTNIYFDENNGEEIEDIRVGLGSMVEEPSSPIRYNYIFDGWYYDASLNEPVSWPIEADGDMTLYASWEIIDETQLETEITFYSTMGQMLSDVFKEHLESFNEKYPNIKVNMDTSIGSYEDIKETTLTELINGTTADIVYSYADHVSTYLKTGRVVSLDDYMSNPNYGYTQEQLNDFIDGFLDEGKSYGDENTYSLPWSKSSDVVYYNKTIFEQHGLEVPTHWFSIDENDTTSLEYICKTLKELYPNSIPFAFDSEYNFFVTQCEQLGLPYLSSTGENIQFDTPEHKELWSKYKTWYDNGWMTTQKLNGSYVSNLFIQTRENSVNSFIVIGASAGATYHVPNKDKNGEYPFSVGVTSIPQHDENNKKVISQGPSVCILDNYDQDKELAAWLLAQYFTTDVEFQGNFSFNSGYAPVIKSAVESTVYQNEYANYINGYLDQKEMTRYSSILVCLEQSTYFTPESFVGSSDVQSYIGSFLPMYFNGSRDLSYEELIEETIDRCESALEYKSDSPDYLDDALTVLYQLYKYLDRMIITEDIILPNSIYVHGKTINISWELKTNSTEKGAELIQYNDYVLLKNYYTSGNISEDIYYELVPTVIYGSEVETLNEDKVLSFYVEQLILNSYEDFIKFDGNKLNIKGIVVDIVRTGSSAGSIYMIDDQGNCYYVYNPVSHEAEIGDEIIVFGKSSTYLGQEEFSKGADYVVASRNNQGSVSFVNATEDWEKASLPTTDGELSNNYQNKPILIENCKPTGIDRDYFYFTVGNGTTEFYIYRSINFLTAEQVTAWVDNYKLALDEGKTFTLRGIAAVYNNKYQVYPCSLQPEAVSIDGDLTIDEKFNYVTKIVNGSIRDIYTEFGEAISFDEKLPSYVTYDMTLVSPEEGSTVNLVDTFIEIYPSTIKTTNVVKVSLSILGETRDVYLDIVTAGSSTNEYKVTAYVSDLVDVQKDVRTYIAWAYNDNMSDSVYGVEFFVNNLYQKNSAVYFYKNVSGDTLTITAPEGYIISKIETTQNGTYDNFVFHNGSDATGEILSHKLTGSLLEITPYCSQVTIDNPSSYTASFTDVTVTITPIV